jgi:alpha-ketoglutarate-dependent 2,4-dichlorophenoxyacetate dioxygenase
VKWNAGDLVIWDNLCSMHKGGEYDYKSFKRDMRRTPVREGTEPHTMDVEGMPKEEGRKLIRELIEHCTQPQYIFSVKWNPGDMVIWDNLCSMHRGGEFDYSQYKRDMRRTTVREGTEPHTMEAGDDPFSELFARTPKIVDIQGARYAGR